VPQTFDPDAGSEYAITVHSKERVNVYAGTEIEWDEDMASVKEGENEMEQDLSKGPAKADDNSFEVDSTTVSLQAAARMVAELTVLARQLEQKKQDLTGKLEGLAARADKL